jgi:hypothetical protein
MYRRNKDEVEGLQAKRKQVRQNQQQLCIAWYIRYCLAIRLHMCVCVFKHVVDGLQAKRKQVRLQ